MQTVYMSLTDTIIGEGDFNVRIVGSLHIDTDARTHARMLTFTPLMSHT